MFKEQALTEYISILNRSLLLHYTCQHLVSTCTPANIRDSGNALHAFKIDENAADTPGIRLTDRNLWAILCRVATKNKKKGGGLMHPSLRRGGKGH